MDHGAKWHHMARGRDLKLSARVDNLNFNAQLEPSTFRYSVYSAIFKM